MEAVRSYDTHLDAKNRITLRGANFKNYNVRVFENGCIILEPRVLTVPDTISERTLADMDQAVANFKLGDVSSAIDLSDFE